MLRFILVSLFAVCCLGATLPATVGKDDRIVGGRPTNIQNYPYQVSLRFSGRHNCGGSLIAKKWVLTAAHCIKSVAPTVHVGTSTRRYTGTVHTVKKQYVHPKYDDISTDYDFALLELNEEVTLSNKVQLIKLADSDQDISVGKKLTVTGWGYISSAGPGSQILQVVQVPVVSQRACIRAYGKITDRMLCAGYLGVGEKDSCQGDSGGPAVANGVQYGVVSFGRGCAEPDFPGVYAKVSDQRQWIKKVSGV